MDLIYTNSARVDQGVLQDYELDLAFGADENNLECKVQAGSHCCESGSLLYIEGTEYGGIIDSIESDTDSKEVIYTGRTWHGILNSKVIQPDSGEAYLVVSGEANVAIANLLSKLALTDLFEASSEDSGLNIRNYKMNRYISGYDGIMKMLKAVGGKLKLTFIDGKVVLAAEAVHDYTQDEEFDADQVPFRAKRNFKGVNHLICLGSGQLEARMVVHLYADTEGNISREQTQFGLDEVCTIFEYSNIGTEEELVQEGRERFRSLMAEDEISIDFNADSDTYDVGDIIGAVDNITGLSAYTTIAKKIVTIKNGQITVRLSPDTAKTGSSKEIGGGSSGGGGGFCPQIIVTAPTGSTVTCSKGNVVLNAEEVDGTWTFNVTDYGEWTVVASLGTKSNSATVQVYAVCQMPIEIALEYATIFVTGLDESSTVTAVKDGKTVQGKWVTEEKEVVTQVPVMTSNTTPSGVASAKSNYNASECEPYFAFTGRPVAGYLAHSIKGDAQGWWLAYNFGYDVTVDSFEFAPQIVNNVGNWYRFPKVVSLQGSNDGAVWNTIQDFDTENPGGYSEPFQIKTFTVDNPQTYSQYRLLWKELTSDNDGYATCSYAQFYGTAVKAVSGHKITIKDYGMWTVTATNGEKTKTQDVLVDADVEYEIEMDYKLWLYREGDECEDVTGGWVAGGTSGHVVTKNVNSIYIKGVGDSNTVYIQTAKAVDLTDYTKICVDISDMTYYRCMPGGNLYIGTTMRGGWARASSMGNGTLPSENFMDADISDISGAHTLKLNLYSGGAYSDTYEECSVYNIWLE